MPDPEQGSDRDEIIADGCDLKKEERGKIDRGMFYSKYTAECAKIEPGR